MIDTSSVQPLEDRARSLEEKAISSSSAQYTLPDKLRSAISERFTDSPLIKQRESALQTFLTSPDRARSEVAGKVASGTILSPTQQQAIISGHRAADTVPLVSLNDLLQSQFGSIGDLVTAGSNAYKGVVAADQGAAGLARQQADSALKRLFDEAAFDLEKQKLAASSAPSPLEAMLQQLLMGQGGTGATGVPEGFEPENKPTGIPSDEFVSRVRQSGGQVNSPGGQWTFLNNVGDWVPAVTEVGTKAVDDTSGASYTFTESGWKQDDTRGFLSRMLFPGLAPR
jgi:hypothetical protein